MKKLLLFLVLIVTINVSAQSTTWFSKPLELDKVPASTSKSDSVLVRGADKIIKFVPRSEVSTPILPVSATQSGIVNNVPLQELGGVDKVINFVRIGRGAGTVNNSTAIGFNVLSNNVSGTNNTGLGARALQDNTTGTVNSAFGSQSLWRNTTGNGNVGLGAASLYSNTLGDNNLGIGYYSLFNNISGVRNIGIGYLAGSDITTGNRNVVIASTPNFTTSGLTTGNNNLIVSPNDGNATGITTGSGNVILGKASGLPTATENTVILADGIGNIVLRKNTNGEIVSPNITNALIDSGGAKSLVTKEYLEAVILPASATQSGIVNNVPLQELGGVDKLINGVRIGRGVVNDSQNVFVTSTGPVDVSNLYSNTALGYNSLKSVTTGGWNTAVGNNTLVENTTGSNNTSIGIHTLSKNLTGGNNTAVGLSSLRNNISGSNNTSVGSSSMFSNTEGIRNVAIGSSSLRLNTTGSNNIALGYSTLTSNQSGNNNIGIGEFSLWTATNNDNIAIGTYSGTGITTGTKNVILSNNVDKFTRGLTTGSNNLIVAPNNGQDVGITTGSGNVILGKVSGLPSSTENTIILSDGVGNIAIRKNANGEIVVPNVTNTLIDSGGAKSLVTKEYLNKIYTNASTTAPTTSVELDTLYPNAKEGDEVTFLDSTPYSLICKKLLSGWVMYQVGKLP